MAVHQGTNNKMIENKVLDRHVRIVFLPDSPIAILELPNCLIHE